mmetsp:Transcript_13833/g.18049  ORF Transcript_13833/g.18049 Transcript_13833/m.18049 type:complete len:183 (+) Transcript_13833:141-689(+)|eukprot:CAMPEP_0198144082 /NCGR_PEP_ID=MMETSP1443-20131203/12874_1 /TAXON_ID=186043 /ORGANISM="Entomoneis sp., Strain CCMP2396" /LENGTH=182 /DNA_ID=CAMNT_0043807421 /DNA_START=91 /DNA_END=639 /DNA_ORIENTATION=+
MTRQTTTTTLFSIALCVLFTTTSAWSASKLSRRELFHAAVSGAAAGVALAVPQASNAASDIDILVEELLASKSKIQEIPDLLQAKDWEKVRSILKTPPVNKLWNLGDSQNPVLKLAKETDNVDLFELKDELAYNLQMADELTYNNVFVYFQPGDGKIKIKEPTQAARKALEDLDQIITESKN